MTQKGRPVRFVKILKKMFPHGKKLGTLTKIPIVGRFFDKLVEGDELIYLTSDKVIPVNQEVEKLDDMILPSKIVEHFINKAKYHWIMSFCICRDAMQCKDYPSEYGCLFMGKAVLGINPQYGRLVSKEEALEHIKKCREAGLVHVIGRNKLDSFWLKARPDHKLLTVCNCCPCCCITRYVALSSTKIKATVTKLPGANMKVNHKCKGCGLCTNVCVFNAISVINKKAKIDDECRACGRCMNICPQQAIDLTLSDENYIEKAIKTIDGLVDIS